MIRTLVFTVACWMMANAAMAQEKIEDRELNTKALIADVKPDQLLLDKFKKLMTGAKLTGMFTIDGRPLDKLVEESYEIAKVEKLPDGDEWAITARIKYGDKDAVFPVPVEVKWAGKTPVITLDNVTIPAWAPFQLGSCSTVIVTLVPGNTMTKAVTCSAKLNCPSRWRGLKRLLKRNAKPPSRRGASRGLRHQ